MSRYRFNIRNRLKDETVKAYVSELQELAKSCKFEDSLKNIMLRDRLVCGINNEAVQRCLLMEPTLTLEQALRIVEEKVHSVSNKNNAFVCYRCGQSDRALRAKLNEVNTTSKIYMIKNG